LKELIWVAACTETEIAEKGRDRKYGKYQEQNWLAGKKLQKN